MEHENSQFTTDDLVTEILKRARANNSALVAQIADMASAHSDNNELYNALENAYKSVSEAKDALQKLVEELQEKHQIEFEKLQQDHYDETQKYLLRIETLENELEILRSRDFGNVSSDDVVEAEVVEVESVNAEATAAATAVTTTESVKKPRKNNKKSQD